MKRALCVIMCCVVVAALSLSVSADPGNIYDGTYVIDEIEFNDTSSLVQFPFDPISLDFGSNYKFNVDFRGYDSSLGYFAPFLNGEFTITLDFPSTVFIACSSNYVITQPVLWDDYRDPDRDFSISYSNSRIPLYNIEFNFYDYDVGNDPISIDYSTSSFSGSITYNCFDDIPAGTYTIGYGFTTAALPIADMSGIICGIYISSFSINDPVGSFQDGLIDFDTAIGAIQDNLQDILDNPNATTDEKILAVNLADYDLDRIVIYSDLHYNTIVSDFSQDADQIIGEFVSGIKDIRSSIDDLQMVYFDALSQAVTPEQGTYLNTSYNAHLAELQLQWDIAYKQELDDVITDEDLQENDDKLSHLDQLYAEEAEVLSHFDLAEYDSYLEFSNWMTHLNDYSSYRSIFEYLFEDDYSWVAQFLIVPFSLVLVSVLLATTTVVIGGFSRYRDSYGTKPFSFRRGGKK